MKGNRLSFEEYKKEYQYVKIPDLICYELYLLHNSVEGLKGSDEQQLIIEALLLDRDLQEEKLDRARLMIEKRDELINMLMKKLYLLQDGHDLSYDEFTRRMKESIK